MSSDFWSPSINPEIQFCGRMLPKVMMSKSVATAHASINQFVPRLNKREPDSFETDVSSAGLCMKCAYKRYPSYPSRPAKQTNRNIRSKSTMRSLHLLGFLVLLAVLSSSMAHHTPDHPDTTTTLTPPPIPDEQRHRRSPRLMQCPSVCCRKGRQIGCLWMRCDC